MSNVSRNHNVSAKYFQWSGHCLMLSLITVQLYSLNIFLHILVSLLPNWVHDTNARLCRKSTAWGHFQRLHASPSLQPAFPLPAPASRGWSTLTLSLPQGQAAGTATAWYLWSKRSYSDQMIVIKSFCRNWRMKWLRSEENTLLLISVRCYYRSLYSSKAKVSMKCSRQTSTAYANQN